MSDSHHFHDQQQQQQQPQRQNISYMLNNNHNMGDPSSQFFNPRLEELNHRTPSLPSLQPGIPPMMDPMYQPQQPPYHMIQEQYDPHQPPQAIPLHPQQYPVQHVFYGYDRQQPQPQPAVYGYRHEEESSRSSKETKRQKTRKKAMVACETCRLKKIRCSNERPSCQSCISHRYTCVYRNEITKERSPPPKISPSPPTTTTSKLKQDISIMNKLDTILNEIASLKDLTKPTNSNDPHLASYVTPLSSDTIDPIKETKRIVQGKWYTAVEFIFQWPCFGNKHKIPNIVESLNTENKRTPSFKIDFNEFTDPVRSAVFSRKLVHSLRYFVNSYVNNVHNKAPVIDLGKLYKTVDYICSSKSFDCIKKEDLETYYSVTIPIFCGALGMLSAPLDVPDGKTKRQYLNSLEQLDQFELLKKFYKAFNFACFKELETQYEYPPDNPFYQLDYCIIQYLKKTCAMYLLKPLEAWKYLSRASSALTLFLRTHTDLNEDNTEGEPESFSNISVDDRKLIERLYWAIYKEESEFRVELSPFISSMPSEILNFPPPSSFPVPVLFDPTKQKNLETASDGSISDIEERELIDTNDCETVREQNDSIWYCYLNEIALRKLENQLLEETFNADPVKTWSRMLTDPVYLNSMLLKIKYYFDEINNYIDKLHPSLKELMEKTEVDVLQDIALSANPVVEYHSPVATETNKKIPFFKISEALVFTKTRIVTMNLILSRPILFYFSMLETKEELMSFVSNPIMATVVKNAFKSANVAQPELLKHRHNGTWYVLRNLLVGCLYILAVVPRLLKFPEVIELLQASGNEGEEAVNLPSRETMSIFIKEIISILKYWADEAPEFHSSINIISEIAKENGFILE